MYIHMYSTCVHASEYVEYIIRTCVCNVCEYVQYTYVCVYMCVGFAFIVYISIPTHIRTYVFISYVYVHTVYIFTHIHTLWCMNVHASSLCTSVFFAYLLNAECI